MYHNEISRIKTIVEDASNIEDGEGVLGVLLSNARLVLTAADDKWPCCKLLGEIADDGNSKKDTEGNTDEPSSKAQLELIATHLWMDGLNEQLILTQQTMMTPA